MALLKAIGLTAIPHIGGLIGAFAMKDQVKNWYVKIEKPPWTPPSWVCHFNSYTAILTTFTYLSIYHRGGKSNRI
jgi:tryptophan-rich sensory protein